MVITNGESSQVKAQRVWTDQEERKPGNDGGWHKRIGRFGEQVGCQPFSSSGINWAEANSLVSAGDDPLGGTVKQLIVETFVEIDEIETRCKKLRQRLTSLDELLGRLKEESTDE